MSSWIPGDPFLSQLAQHPLAATVIAAVSLAAAYVVVPRAAALWRSVLVRLGLSKGAKDKVDTFMRQHAKNMLEAESNPSFAFSIINHPALEAASHRIALGILPNDSLLADIKRSSLVKPAGAAAAAAPRNLAVISVVDHFELHTEFDYT